MNRPACPRYPNPSALREMGPWREFLNEIDWAWFDWICFCERLAQRVIGR